MLVCSYCRHFIGLWEKYLTHPCHPIVLARLHAEVLENSRKKKKKIWLLWASMQRREKPNTILLSFSSKSNRKVIYKHISNITWHIHIFKLKMLSISSYLSEHMSFNINFALTRFTFISPFIIPM